jgi:hypothetical protein
MEFNEIRPHWTQSPGSAQAPGDACATRPTHASDLLRANPGEPLDDLLRASPGEPLDDLLRASPGEPLDCAFHAPPNPGVAIGLCIHASPKHVLKFEGYGNQPAETNHQRSRGAHRLFEGVSLITMVNANAYRK